MSRDIRCPHCDEVFFAGGTAVAIDCPMCGESIAAAPPGPHAPGPAPAAAVTATAAPGSPARIELRRSCPSCGERYEGSKKRCPACGAGFRAAKLAKEDEASDAFTPEKAGVRKGVLGGIVMIAIAAVWLFAGLAADRIFFYPPVLAVIGLYAVVKGLATGNLAGEKRTPPGRR